MPIRLERTRLSITFSSAFSSTCKNLPMTLVHCLCRGVSTAPCMNISPFIIWARPALSTGGLMGASRYSMTVRSTCRETDSSSTSLLDDINDEDVIISKSRDMIRFAKSQARKTSAVKKN
jgi:hypothetical protein